ncbi:SagB/ThcOx family dehydrogenase [Zoogloea sp. LCSB751]|uniref:SagB/ThcOx family dehydrogenase n=1 Tax=Zoogloea sp. LCSB751 TaxID=1965277 RepID=UPI001C1F5C64|nr:SagB/ThcOx family dehydrogenase [Zoogloea sp. LCSB751]
MPETLAAPPDVMPAPLSAAAVVQAYHQRTKHRFEAYAASPGTLDWDAQPAAFRHYEGVPPIELPLARAEDLTAAPVTPAIPDLASIGALLHLSFGLTAWKTLGPDRWAVRANPSSGNLHPVEAYVIVAGIPELADGLYHYRPEIHALELRAVHLQPVAAGPVLAVGLSCVMWREAWKYGERAFRYCQLDAGHAQACLGYAAALLGWHTVEQPQVGSHTLASLLGLDRAAEFPGKRAEVSQEEAELLLVLDFAGCATRLEPAALHEASAAARWQGVASLIDRFPMFRWPVIADVAAATRRADDSGAASNPQRIPRVQPAALILRRRSAQRFDPAHVMGRAEFERLLEALRPAADARIGLLMFIHRVDGLAPGVYFLPRGALDGGLAQRLQARYKLLPVDGLPAADALFSLAPADPLELRRVARSLHCHQDIASNASIAFGMLAPFAERVEADPPAYRDLYREAGALGQVLYLEAEALGLRGTGIGCFFDDPVHSVAGLDDGVFQTLYHFTIGLPVIDGRVETTPPYPGRKDALR